MRLLWDAVRECIGLGLEEIESPCESFELQKRLNVKPVALSREEVEKFLTCLFLEGIEAYRMLVEANFAGLRSFFRLYNRLPVIAVAVVSADPGDLGPDSLTVEYGFVDTKDTESSVRIAFREACEGSDKSAEVSTARDVLKRAPVVSATSLAELLRPDLAPGFGGWSHDPARGEKAPVRGLAYHIIESEFERIPISALSRID